MERLRSLQQGDQERAEALRLVGGLLLGIGAIVLAYRTTSLDTRWAKFPEFLITSIPCAILLAGGVAGSRAIGRARPWHAVYAVFGLILLPIVGYQFVDMIGGDIKSNWHAIWIFGLSAGLAWVAGMQTVRFAWLLAGLALLVVWYSFWSEILDPGPETFRWLSMIAAVALAGGGYYMRERDGEAGRARTAEWFTAAGVAFIVGAGILSVIGAIGTGLYGAIAFSGVGSAPAPARPSAFWDTVLLLGSIGLVAAGTRYVVRGPVYLGGAGLFLFSVIVGLDLDDPSPEGTVFGWPVLLLVLAAVAIALSTTEVRDRIASRRGSGPGSSSGSGEPPLPTPDPPNEPQPPPSS